MLDQLIQWSFTFEAQQAVNIIFLGSVALATLAGLNLLRRAH